MSDIPVFTLEEDVQDDLEQIVHAYGEETIFRIINAGFIPDALEFGTDKAHVEEYDFRKIIPTEGYDIARVEDKAIDMGLRKSDVFCGIPYSSAVRFTLMESGLPKDRRAILIFDKTKLQFIEETDGYAFKEPNNKKAALIGVVRFKEHLVEFEKRLVALNSIDDKVQLLEDEVLKKLNTSSDLEKVPYIGVNLVSLLIQESRANFSQPSSISADRINKLEIIAKQLNYEARNYIYLMFY